jgi:hypothetical protein
MSGFSRLSATSLGLSPIIGIEIGEDGLSIGVFETAVNEKSDSPTLGKMASGCLFCNLHARTTSFGSLSLRSPRKTG